MNRLFFLRGRIYNYTIFFEFKDYQIIEWLTDLLNAASCSAMKGNGTLAKDRAEEHTSALGMSHVHFLTLKLAMRKRSLLICAMICFRVAAVEASYHCAKVCIEPGIEHLVVKRPDPTIQAGKERDLAWKYKGSHAQMLRINGGNADYPRNGVVKVVSISGIASLLVLIHRFVLC